MSPDGLFLAGYLKQDKGLANRLAPNLAEDLRQLEGQRTKAALYIADTQGVDMDAQIQYNNIVGAIRYVKALIESCENKEETDHEY